MADRLDDRDWETLLQRIKDGKCTPFLGAGASAEVVPLGSQLATRWAEAHGYPLRDSTQLARVAQYLAVERDPYYPKEVLQREFEAIEPPDFSQAHSPHGILADLDLPLYLTTNYDGFMEAALRDRKRDPRTENCRWNDYLHFEAPDNPNGDSAPTVANPVVYHLHGHYELPQSLVLTEDDYLDFLVRLTRDQQDMLPAYIRAALAGTSLLFVGYSLADWSFRVLFRGLVSSLGAQARMTSIAVQLMTDNEDTTPAAVESAKAYMSNYFSTIQEIKVRTYWGPASEFAEELSSRWHAFA
ncbi:MAG: SIR2 family protein [Actinomycetota bacterium]|nr:SIR2 family protein [Actinomycetota bacterium]